jgi:hypothetical protein
MATRKSKGVEHGTGVENGKRPKRGARLPDRLVSEACVGRDDQHEQLDDHGGGQRPGGGQQRHRRHEHDHLAVSGDVGGALPSDQPHHDDRGSHNGSERVPENQGEVGPHPRAKVSIDRLDEIIKSTEKWHLRSVYGALLEEDWGDGYMPMHRDIQTVGDIIRIGSAGLSMRFREVDPVTWQWLIDELEALRA